MSTQTIAQSKPRPLSPVLALLWEEWRQTRVPLLGGVAVALLAVAVILGIGRWTDSRDVSEPLFAVMVQLFFWQTAILLFSGYGRNDLTLQFPCRLFALPVHSITLALTRVVYGVVVVAITFGVLGWIATLSDDTPGLGYVCVLVAVQALLYLEAIAWLLGRRPILAVGVALALWFPIAILIKSLYELALPLHGLGAGLLASFSASVVFASLAVYAVSAQRSGRMPGRPAYLGWFKPAPASAEGVTLSSRRALFGFEWYRRGRWVPAFGLAGFIFAVPICAIGLLNPEYVHSALNLGAVAGCAAAGLFQVLVTERDRISGVHRFISTKPFSTPDLANARLQALGAGWGVTYVLVFLGSLLLPFLFHTSKPSLEVLAAFSPVSAIESRVELLKLRCASLDTPNIPSATASPSGAVPTGSPGNRQTRAEAHHPARDLAVPVLRDWRWDLLKASTGVVFVFLIGWLFLSQPFVTLALAHAAAAVVSKGDTDFGRDVPWSVTLPYLVLAAGVLGATVLLFRRAYRLGLLRKRPLLLALGAWLVLACSGLFLFALAGTTPQEAIGLRIPVLGEALVAAAAAVLLWPLATTPLSVYRHRHQ